MSSRFLNARPSRYLLRLEQKISVSFSFSVSAVLAEWGLIITLGMSQSGMSGGRGSTSATSRAAPPKCPDSRALMRVA